MSQGNGYNCGCLNLLLEWNGEANQSRFTTAIIPDVISRHGRCGCFSYGHERTRVATPLEQPSWPIASGNLGREAAQLWGKASRPTACLACCSIDLPKLHGSDLSQKLFLAFSWTLVALFPYVRMSFCVWRQCACMQVYWHAFRLIFASCNCVGSNCACPHIDQKHPWSINKNGILLKQLRNEFYSSYIQEELRRC